jgi:hypothetical protein
MLSEIYDGPGFSTLIRLKPVELELIRSFIRDQWTKVLVKTYPNHKNLFSSIQLPDYHTIGYLIDHKSLWNKEQRILPPEMIVKLKQLPFFAQLRTYFNRFIVSNEELIQEEEVYWRIVRPNAPSDIGPLHADRWFWDLGHGIMPLNHKRVKVWIPLYCEAGSSGLRVVPNSHKANIPYEAELRDGMLKPKILVGDSDLDLVTLNTPPGQVVVFHDNLIHGGAPSLAYTRYSIEFTMLVPDYNDLP